MTRRCGSATRQGSPTRLGGGARSRSCSPQSIQLPAQQRTRHCNYLPAEEYNTNFVHADTQRPTLTVLGAAPNQPGAGVEAGFGAQALEAISHDGPGARAKVGVRQRPHAPVGQAQAAAHHCCGSTVPVVVAAARLTGAAQAAGGTLSYRGPRQAMPGRRQLSERRCSRCSVSR